MKGLFIKDIRLLAGQTHTLLVIFVIGAIFAVTQEQPELLIGYVMMVMSMLTITSISYDEFDNGMPFLMTLPSGRSGYVKEKYLLTATIVTVAYVTSNTMLFLLGQFNKNSESWDVRWNLQFSFIFAVVMLLMLYTLIPIILKVGVEKGRIAQFGIFGIIFLVGYMGSNIIEKMDLDLSKITEFFNSMSKTLMICICMCLLSIYTILSYLISKRIVENKDF